MTTKEREVIQDFINQMSVLSTSRDACFKALQHLNLTCGEGCRWCCAKANLDGIRNKSKDKMVVIKAEHLYEKYVEDRAKLDMIQKFLQSLTDIGWRMK